jgi:hypothetical protein
MENHMVRLTGFQVMLMMGPHYNEVLDTINAHERGLFTFCIPGSGASLYVRRAGPVTLFTMSN